jgi:hypothetical protein
MRRGSEYALLIVIAVIALSGCTVKHIVSPVTHGKLPENGLVYALPQTRLIVEVPVTLEVEKPGPFLKDVNDYEKSKDTLRAHSSDALSKTVDYLNQATKKSLSTPEEDKEPGDEIAKRASALKAQAGSERAAAFAQSAQEAWVALQTLANAEDAAVLTAEARLRLLLYNLDIPYPKKDDQNRKLLVGTPTVSSEAVPDPKNVYVVRIKGGKCQDRTLNLTLTESGLLSKGVSEAKDRTVELIAETVKAAAGIAAEVVKMGAPSAARFDATHPNPYTKALLIAGAISDVRADILKVQSSTSYMQMSPETLQLMLAELRKQEDALVAYFWETSVTGWKARIETVPEQSATLNTPAESETANEIVLFSTIKTKDGVYLRDTSKDLVAPPPKDFTKEADVPKPAVKTYKVVIKEEKDQVAGAFKAPEESGELGFRYRVPGLGLVTVERHEEDEQGNKQEYVLTRSRIPVAQFGKVVALPADTGSSDTQYSIELFTDLGAIKNIRIESKALQIATVQSSGAAAQAVVGAVAAQKAEERAEEEGKTETALLEKEVKLLKLKKEKKELEEALQD